MNEQVKKEMVAEAFKMLGGEDSGWGQQCALPAVHRGGVGGESGDHGFTRAHITL